MKRSTPLTRNIGAKVKYYRKLRGLSQKQLAAQLQANCNSRAALAIFSGRASIV